MTFSEDCYHFNFSLRNMSDFPRETSKIKRNFWNVNPMIITSKWQC